MATLDCHSVVGNWLTRIQFTMNNRKLLLWLLGLTCLVTAAMVVASRRFPTLQLPASQFLFRARIVNMTRQTAGDLSGSSTNVSESQRPALSGSDNSTSNADRNSDNRNATTPKAATPSPPKNPPQPTNRPMLCQGCFFSDFPSLIENPSICFELPGSTKPEMIMMITSSLDGFERRQAIRDTWASVSKNNTAHVRYVFLLGTTGDRKVSDDVRAESSRYQDMLVSDFVDAYANLTYKTMVGLHWIVRHCGHIK